MKTSNLAYLKAALKALGVPYTDPCTGVTIGEDCLCPDTNTTYSFTLEEGDIIIEGSDGSSETFDICQIIADNCPTVTTIINSTDGSIEYVYNTETNTYDLSISCDAVNDCVNITSPDDSINVVYNETTNTWEIQTTHTIDTDTILSGTINETTNQVCFSIINAATSAVITADVFCYDLPTEHVIVQGSNCITVTTTLVNGVTTYTITPRIDPSSSNILECTTDGLYVQGTCSVDCTNQYIEVLLGTELTYDLSNLFTVTDCTPTYSLGGFNTNYFENVSISGSTLTYDSIQAGESSIQIKVECGSVCSDCSLNITTNVTPPIRISNSDDSDLRAVEYTYQSTCEENAVDMATSKHCTDVVFEDVVREYDTSGVETNRTVLTTTPKIVNICQTGALGVFDWTGSPITNTSDQALIEAQFMFFVGGFTFDKYEIDGILKGRIRDTSLTGLEGSTTIQTMPYQEVTEGWVQIGSGTNYLYNLGISNETKTWTADGNTYQELLQEGVEWVFINETVETTGICEGVSMVEGSNLLVKKAVKRVGGTHLHYIPATVPTTNTIRAYPSEATSATINSISDHLESNFSDRFFVRKSNQWSHYDDFTYTLEGNTSTVGSTGADYWFLTPNLTPTIFPAILALEGTNRIGLYSKKEIVHLEATVPSVNTNSPPFWTNSVGVDYVLRNRRDFDFDVLSYVGVTGENQGFTTSEIRVLITNMTTGDILRNATSSTYYAGLQGNGIPPAVSSVQPLVSKTSLSSLFYNRIKIGDIYELDIELDTNGEVAKSINQFIIKETF